MARRRTARITSPSGATAPAQTAQEPLGDLRFVALLDPGDWAALPAAVRRRFSKRLADARTAVYRGEITEMRMSRAGSLLAQLARLMGGPLPTGSEVGVPAIVTVTEDVAGTGQFWTRIYGRRRGFPQVIHSSKRFRGPTGLEEYLGRGLVMTLTVNADRTAIHFRSNQYFLEFLGRRWRLPGWLSPGVVTVSHIDRGGGRFNFVLELRHPVLGILIRQIALFSDWEPGER